jgi:Ca-activated chloride channel family protein
VSALGIGTDFDDAYLAGVSDAGRGNYEFLRDSSALSRFLSKELRETAETHVRRVELRLDLPSEARIVDVWGATRSGDTLSLGSLFAGDERRVLVSLAVTAGVPGSAIELGGSLRWDLVDGSPVELGLKPLSVTAVASPEQVDDARDMSVIASAASVIASQRETEAAAAFEKGDRTRALALNAESRMELDKVARVAPPAVASKLEAQKRAYQSHQQVFASEPPTATAAAAPARDIGSQERKNAGRAVAY